jgi:hypothetical protein
MHSTIDYFSFEIIYDFNPLTTFDLFPLHIDEIVNLNSNRIPHIVKTLQENMRRQIYIYIYIYKQYAFNTNKGKIMVIF